MVYFAKIVFINFAIFHELSNQGWLEADSATLHQLYYCLFCATGWMILKQSDPSPLKTMGQYPIWLCLMGYWPERAMGLHVHLIIAISNVNVFTQSPVSLQWFLWCNIPLPQKSWKLEISCSFHFSGRKQWRSEFDSDLWENHFSGWTRGLALWWKNVLLWCW